MVEKALLDYGLSGIVIFVLGGVVVWQQRRNDLLSKEKEALQDLRYRDLMEMKDKYAEVLSGFSQTADLLYTKLTSKNGG